MVRVDLKLYRKYVLTSAKGEPIICVKLNKALYGLLKSALLFYKKMVGELEDMGFEINPYDPCVANITENGSHQTVTWHVDDLKISNVGPMVNTEFLLKLAKIYGPGITLSRGKVHNYLGMDLDYSIRGKVKFSMIKYLDKIILIFLDNITSTAESPAADHLFQTREEDENIKVLPE